ncbi:MAG TPA: hypothetical protein VE077_20135 [Candidatus Methylomirabilis sp.]|nr:hypothetical protein [Candidatus Methylomirabilis sp.]
MASAPSAQAQEVTFHKTRYSSVKQPKESDVALTVTGSKVVIKGKKENGVSVDIPFSAIDAMSYEMAARHRVQEGAGVMLLSPGVGAILMATKTKSHWLDIEYHEGDAVQEMILRLDKSEYENVLSTLEARTGKHIARLDSKSSPLNPTAESKDMDEVVPFRKEGVVAALKSAMESFGCKVTDENAKHIECKRARGMSDRTGNGGEKVTAELQAEGDQTRVRIRTFKGTLGRLEKKNWSKPIFEEMMKRLPQPAVSASVGGVD